MTAITNKFALILGDNSDCPIMPWVRLKMGRRELMAKSGRIIQLSDWDVYLLEWRGKSQVCSNKKGNLGSNVKTSLQRYSEGS